MSEQNPIVQVKNLCVNIKMDEGLLTPVRGVDFAIHPGETLGLVGESGCGKSLTSKAILRINDKKCKATGEIRFETKEGNLVDVNQLDPKGRTIRDIRGKQISMIFQEPMTAFSPMYTIGDQVNECTRLHIEKDKRKSKEITLAMMKKVGIAGAERRYDQYPHEFSGGMLQRALIAMALVCNPELLIADEPTTALDVTIQAQILSMMRDLKKDFNTSMLLITHDLGVVAETCDRVAIMYAGEIVECGSLADIFENAQHPYTIGLFNSIPSLTKEMDRLEPIPGLMPDPMNLGPYCSFADRCPYATERCRTADPAAMEISEGHMVKCFRIEGTQEVKR